MDGLENASATAKNQAEAAKSDITKSSSIMSDSLNSGSQKVINQIGPIGTPPAAFEGTKNAFNKVNQDIGKYIENIKKSCTSAAEKAGFLCMESTSPGVQAAKTLMDVAGPALALINSAQKSCSSTANLTKFLGAGLTIAKGACVGAKLYCDNTCANAVKELQKLSETANTAISEAIESDVAKAEGEANQAISEQNYKLEADITSSAKQKVQASNQGQQDLTQLIQKELDSTPGTSPNIALKCQDHAKDIALLAVNILGTLKAQKGAEDCAEKLKSDTGTSTADYCAQPANVTSSFCKCKIDSSQVGCTGHIVGLESDPSLKQDDGGVDLRNSAGGVSAFAGPGIGTGNMDTGKINSPIANGSSGPEDKKNLNSEAAAKGGFNGTGSSGSAGLGGSGAGSAELGSAELGSGKKWNFGAFSGGGGSGFGGSGKGGSGSSGSVGQKDLNAQRAIASEQFRAQVSEASGKSNWEKVSERYLRKTSSLIGR